MRRLLASAVLMLGALVVAAAQPPAERVELVLKESVRPRHGLWGLHVVSLSRGEPVFAFQADSFFVPASTAKLFSTAAALMRLGPDYRFRTTVVASAGPDSAGVIRGDVRLVGGGDPTLSGRPFPYRREPQPGNPMEPLLELAEAVARKGVTRIEGDIVGDDTAYYWEPYPAGRAQEDALWEYGAPVSALSFHDNRVSIVVRPGSRVGDAARIEIQPRVEYFFVQNRVQTVAGRSSNVQIGRAPGSRQLRIWGTIGVQSKGEGRSLAVDDPALYAAAAFREALIRRGITVTGRAVARHLYPGEPAPAAVGAAGEAILAERVSPPLADILTVINKESVNLYAELLVCELGRRRAGIGSRAAGLEELGQVMREAGVPEGEARLFDGSGLSMLNMVTPRALTALLAWMDKSPYRQTFRNSLAVAGEEGTLRQRFASQQAARRILGKTGTLSRVNAIAGYAETGDGERLAFAILVNNHAAAGAEVRAIVDRICMLLVE